MDFSPQTTTAAVAEQAAAVQDGIHFGLPEAVYRAVDALGSTDLKALHLSPREYWRRAPFNPDRAVDDDSPDKAWGRALHKRVLEGAEAFAAAYAVEPVPEDHPGALVTADDIKRRLKELDLAVSGAKTALIERLRTRDTDTPVWDEIESRAAEQAMAQRRVLLKRRIATEIERATALINRDPTLARAFQGGTAEVSVVWTGEDGIRLKARMDYLKPRAWVDLKKIATRGLPMRAAMRQAWGSYRYDMQVAHYAEGWAALTAMAGGNAVFGHCPLPSGWERRLVGQEDVVCTMIWHQSDGANLTRGVEIPAPASHPALARARADIAEARRRYAEARERFGTGEWFDDEPVLTLSDADVPVWMRAEVEVVADADA